MPNKNSISTCVQTQLQIYLDDLKGMPPSDVYDMVLTVVEKPMLEIIMRYANQNQSLAAQYLGLNRNTLHKKLRQYHLIK